MDFIAAQDQALGMFRQALKRKPTQFVVCWEDTDEDGEAILATTIFAKPDFLVHCIPVLMGQVVFGEPDVEPPPE